MQKLNILVVDDEADVAGVLKRQLEKTGHAVRTASDGVEALEVFRAGDFDAVVTDLNMPRMQGAELVREIKTLSPDTITVVLTGFASLESAIAVMREGCDDYLLKPLPDLAQITRSIERCAARRNIRSIAGSGTALDSVCDSLPDLCSEEFDRRLAELEEFARREAPDGPTGHEILSVLIVDGDDEFRDIVSWAFMESGHEVASASTGAQAVEMAPLGDFDAIIMERRLPDMDGATCVACMREKGLRAPVLVVSACAAAFDGKRLAELGAAEVIPKPVRIAELIKTVRSLAKPGEATSPASCSPSASASGRNPKPCRRTSIPS